jgi:hypothetical protein
MGRNDIYRAPALQSGYDPKDEPIVTPADPEDARRPLEAATADLSDPADSRPVPGKQPNEEQPVGRERAQSNS